MNLTRRTLITSIALTPLACAVPLAYQRGIPVAQPQTLPTVRPPQVGQEWTYIKRDVFNGKNLGVVTDRVVSVGSTIVIERTLNDDKLANEVQGPWGMVQTDPQWSRDMSRAMNFTPAIPLWPLELSSSWSKQFTTKYQFLGYPGYSYGWQEFMSSHGWEQITVPAGTFLTIRYQNLINYVSEDDNKVNCIRKETLWFAPSIGRWVARESTGSYQIQGQIGVPILEDSLQWQLNSYK